MNVKIDRDTCIGCGICVSMCPEGFEMDDDNIAVVKTNPVPGELEAAVREAAENCAVTAIQITK